MADSMTRWLDTIERLRSGKVSRDKLRTQFDRKLAADVGRLEKQVGNRKKAKERHAAALARMKKPRDAKVTLKAERPRCGARTRKGTPCQARAVWDTIEDKPRVKNGRCRMHGGLTPFWHEIGRTSRHWKRPC